MAEIFFAVSRCFKFSIRDAIIPNSITKAHSYLMFQLTQSLLLSYATPCSSNHLEVLQKASSMCSVLSWKFQVLYRLITISKPAGQFLSTVKWICIVLHQLKEVTIKWCSVWYMINLNYVCYHIGFNWNFVEVPV